MSHCSPWMRMIRSEVCGTILADLETRSQLLDGDIDNTVFVPGRLDCICVALLVHFHSHIFGIKAGLRLVKTIVLQWVRAELMFPRSFVVEDFGIELGCGVDATNDSGSVKLRQDLFSV